MNDKYIINFYEWFEANKLLDIPEEEAFIITLLYLFCVNMYQIGETSHKWSQKGKELLSDQLDETCKWKEEIEQLEVKDV